MNLLKTESSKEVGTEAKRLCRGWDHDHLLTVLTQGNQDAIALGGRLAAARWA
ncbi:MAG: hypothetical protein JXO22_04925 [Phycisphaerae bacterium]|nr:hypothetical protein [Phycisphaerae bacterium]